MTATRPAPTDAQVEAMARVLYAHMSHDPHCRCDLSDNGTWEDPSCVRWRRSRAIVVARAALSSSVIGDLIAEEGARALTETADAWQHGQWADAPRCADRVQERIANGQHVTDWLHTRAAALSPTPASPCPDCGGDGIDGAGSFREGVSMPCTTCNATGLIAPADGTTSERSEA